MEGQLVLPLCYFAPVNYWVEALRYKKVLLDPFEFHIKQSYRSRCAIYAVNGVQNLTVVTDNKGSKCPMNESTLVDYEPWRKVHIKALESAYYSSPFFEFYQKEIETLINSEYSSLAELNMATINWVNKVLELGIEFEHTVQFHAGYPDSMDMRPGKKNTFGAEEGLKPYIQVFSDKGLPFVPNLSILDLIFNLGQESRIYLKEHLAK